MSAFPIINRQYYGDAPIGTVYGWQMLGSGIGMASGSFLGGVLRDLTGAYTLALVCSFVLSMMGDAVYPGLALHGAPSDTGVGKGAVSCASPPRRAGVRRKAKPPTLYAPAWPRG